MPKRAKKATPSPRSSTKKSSAAPAKPRTVAKPTPKPGKRKPAAAAGKPRATPGRSAVDRLRRICLALPEVVEVEAWGEPTFRVKGKIFAMHASSGTHHGAGRPAVWILSVSLEQDLVLRARPDRYFKPPYVGPSGWIGAWLDRNPPWTEIEELVRDAWRRRAPKKLSALVPD